MESEVQSWNVYNHVVRNSEEFSEFVEYVKQQGGNVTHTISLRNEGLSVQYRLPGNSNE